MLVIPSQLHPKPPSQPLQVAQTTLPAGPTAGAHTAGILLATPIMVLDMATVKVETMPTLPQPPPQLQQSQPQTLQAAHLQPSQPPLHTKVHTIGVRVTVYLAQDSVFLPLGEVNGQDGALTLGPQHTLHGLRALHLHGLPARGLVGGTLHLLQLLHLVPVPLLHGLAGLLDHGEQVHLGLPGLDVLPLPLRLL